MYYILLDVKTQIKKLIKVPLIIQAIYLDHSYLEKTLL